MLSHLSVYGNLLPKLDALSFDARWSRAFPERTDSERLCSLARGAGMSRPGFRRVFVAHLALRRVIRSGWWISDIIEEDERDTCASGGMVVKF